MERKHSKQRQAIWDYLKDRKDHPTADTIYNGVRETYPNISLGTVYRNLMLMKDMGMLQTVDVGDGSVHFDPNPKIHNHFVCRNCGHVLDLNIGDPFKVIKIADSGFNGLIEGCNAYFFGLCPDCFGKIPVSSNEQSLSEPDKPQEQDIPILQKTTELQ